MPEDRRPEGKHIRESPHAHVTTMFALTEIPKLLLNMDYVDNQFVRIKSNQFGCPTEVVNQSVSLHCNATGYQEMIWYKNGQLLDVNSTDIVFNQTTSSWTITKNNPCDLLGVYQCFVSNEVGTVHVSTRVLPLGEENNISVCIIRVF